MILIYNLSGLLVGLAGVVLGGAVAVLSGFLSLGLLVLAFVWIAGGIWARNRPVAGGGKRPFPSIFFIPTPFLAVVPLGLAILIGVVEVAGLDRRNDPRAQTLRETETTFRMRSISGDTGLAMAIHKSIAGGNFAGSIPSDVGVHAEFTPTAVLVIVKIDNLTKFSSTGRLAVLETISRTVKESPDHGAKAGYFGVKGRLSYGAVKTPQSTVLKTTTSDALLPFYGPDPRTVKP